MNDRLPQGDAAYCGDPDDPLCGPDMGKPWCAYHGGTDETPQGDFREAPFCQIDPDNGPSPFSRRTAEHDIFRIIADRIEKKGLNDV